MFIEKSSAALREALANTPENLKEHSMKLCSVRYLSVVLAFLAAAGNTVAQAADAGSAKDAGYGALDVPATWTGFYVGTGPSGNLSLSGVKAGAGASKYTLPAGSAEGGWAAAGYNLQLGPMVFGIEANLNYSQMGMSGSNAVLGQVSVFEQDVGSIQARAGFVYGSLLFYGTGGLEFTKLDFKASGVRDSSWNDTLVVGTGIEYAVDRSRWLMLRAEAKVYSIDEKNLGFPTGSRDAYEDFGVLRIGIIRKY